MSRTEEPCLDRAFGDIHFIGYLGNTPAVHIVHDKNISVFRKDESQLAANQRDIFSFYDIGNEIAFVRYLIFRNIAVIEFFASLMLLLCPAAVDIAHYLPDPTGKALGAGAAA